MRFVSYLLFRTIIYLVSWTWHGKLCCMVCCVALWLYHATLSGFWCLDILRYTWVTILFLYDLYFGGNNKTACYVYYLDWHKFEVAICKNSDHLVQFPTNTKNTKTQKMSSLIFHSSALTLVLRYSDDPTISNIFLILLKNGPKWSKCFANGNYSTSVWF